MLEVTNLTLFNPAPDSFDLGLTTVFHTDSKYHPRLDAFNASLQLPDSDVPFAYLDIPAMDAGDGVESQVSQRVQIADLTEYTKYVATTLGTEEYSIVLKGKGGLKQGGLPNTNVNYNKEIKMKGASTPLLFVCTIHSPSMYLQIGLNSLKGFNVTEFNILTTPQDDGSNANGTLVIPNPTAMTVQLGTVTLSMSVDGTPVGDATINDMILAPGDNTMEMRAVTNQTAVLGFIFNQYKDGILPIDVVGNTTTFNGQPIPYYQIPLQHNVLRLDLDVIDALERAGLAELLGINRTAKA